MKQTNRIMTWLVACGLALAMVASASAQSAKDRTGKVIRLKGAARVSGGNNVWQPLKLGDEVRAGMLIQTAADSFVDIALGEYAKPAVKAKAAPTSATGYQPKAEQDVVRVQADSTLGFDRLSVIDTGTDQVTDTQLDLRGGRIFGSAKKLNATSRYEVKLPNGVAGIRGTVFSITADGIVQVLSGTVVISWTGADGSVQTQTVNGGYQFDARTGLVTPLPEGAHQELTSWIMGQLPTPGPIPFTVDTTTYFVSPDTDLPSSGTSEGTGGDGGYGEGGL